MVESPLFDLVSQIKQAKENIRSFIKDQSIPFEERLSIFVYTPDELMMCSSTVIDIRGFSINWYADMDYERGARIDLRELVADQTAHFLIEEWAPDKFRKFQEAVLSEGIHQFYFNW